jgi:hypothetical protein
MVCKYCKGTKFVWGWFGNLNTCTKCLKSQPPKPMPPKIVMYRNVPDITEKETIKEIE